MLQSESVRAAMVLPSDNSLPNPYDHQSRPERQPERPDARRSDSKVVPKAECSYYSSDDE
jgi:hypothetical protein